MQISKAQQALIDERQKKLNGIKTRYDNLNGTDVDTTVNCIFLLNWNEEHPEEAETE